MYPILLEFGVITVFSLWFFIAVGFVAGAFLFVRLAKRYRIRLTVLTEKSFALFLFALLVSRLFFVISHPEFYFYQFKLLHIFALWDKGLSFWGAFVGFMIGLLYFSKHNREILPAMLDLLVPAVLLGMAISNFGAFLDGANHGTPTSLPWGVSFRNANVKYISEVHPTQIYALLYTAAIAFFITVLLKKLRGRLPGFAAEFGAWLFSFFKFLEEFVRGDETFEILKIRLPLLLAGASVIFFSFIIYQRYTNRLGGDPDRMLKQFVSRIILRRPHQKPNSQITAAKTESLQNQKLQIQI